MWLQSQYSAIISFLGNTSDGRDTHLVSGTWLLILIFHVWVILSRSTSLSLNFFHLVSDNLKISTVTETAATKQNPFFPLSEYKTRLQFQISLEAPVVMWWSSRQQKVTPVLLVTCVYLVQPFTSRVEWQGPEQPQKWLIEGGRAAVSLGP